MIFWRRNRKIIRSRARLLSNPQHRRFHQVTGRRETTTGPCRVAVGRCRPDGLQRRWKFFVDTLMEIRLTLYFGWRLLAWRAFVVAAWSSWLVWGIAIWQDRDNRPLFGPIVTGALAVMSTPALRRAKRRSRQEDADGTILAERKETTPSRPDPQATIRRL
jgi:hypothetical protein